MQQNHFPIRFGDIRPLAGLPPPHSHSMVLSDDNALIYQCKFFRHTTKNRLADPSKIRALEFKSEFRRFRIRSVSRTIGIDWSNLEIFREDGIIGFIQKDRQQWRSVHSILV